MAAETTVPVGAVWRCAIAAQGYADDLALVRLARAIGLQEVVR